jgi:hypothetical protein
VNVNQKRAYAGHYTTKLDPVSRWAFCAYCRFQASTPRRGRPGGALAASARLFGIIATHLREKHPEVLLVEEEDPADVTGGTS